MLSKTGMRSLNYRRCWPCLRPETSLALARAMGLWRCPERVTDPFCGTFLQHALRYSVNPSIVFSNLHFFQTLSFLLGFAVDVLYKILTAQDLQRSRFQIYNIFDPPWFKTTRLERYDANSGSQDQLIFQFTCSEGSTLMPTAQEDSMATVDIRGRVLPCFTRFFFEKKCSIQGVRRVSASIFFGFNKNLWTLGIVEIWPGLQPSPGLSDEHESSEKSPPPIDFPVQPTNGRSSSSSLKLLQLPLMVPKPTNTDDTNANSNCNTKCTVTLATKKGKQL